MLDLNALLKWCVDRQTGFEGGFNGRSNKLVDGCYSFWIGGCFPLLQALEAAKKQQKKLFDIQTMDYIQLEVSQAERASADLLEDKGIPAYSHALHEGKHLTREFLEHPELTGTEWLFDQTALQEYILLCCQQPNGGLRDKPGKSRDFYHTCYTLSGLSIAQHNPSHAQSVLGDSQNALRVINPVFNICRDKVEKCWAHFKQNNL